MECHLSDGRIQAMYFESCRLPGLSCTLGCVDRPTCIILWVLLIARPAMYFESHRLPGLRHSLSMKKAWLAACLLPPTMQRKACHLQCTTNCPPRGLSLFPTRLHVLFPDRSRTSKVVGSTSEMQSNNSHPFACTTIICHHYEIREVKPACNQLQRWTQGVL